MPKKRRQYFESFKPSSAASPASHSASGSSDKQQSQRSVNDLLANLRRTSLGPSAPHQPPGNNPSVPPAIREILQIPETPAPAPRRIARSARSRFDQHGRRLPAGPPPPRSWTSANSRDASSLRRSALPVKSDRSNPSTLPDTYLPEPGSLVDLVLRDIAGDWVFQREYNQYHLFFLPNHLKPALIRLIGLEGSHGVSVSDLRTILLPATNVYGEEELEVETGFNREVTYLDLTGSLGRSLKLKELADLLFPAKQLPETEELSESWEVAESNSPPIPPQVLLPNLTHLSLALSPQHKSGGSWRQLLSLSSNGKLSNITHLNLAHWPDPCLTPRAMNSTISSPQGRSVPYGGTGYYSHSLDDDWSEALLVLRMLSRNMYELEFLDLTGCASWFKALYLDSGHDYIDWAGSWGKIRELRLCMGWEPDENTLQADKEAFEEAIHHARRVEKHIRAIRAGQGRFIVVEKDTLDA